MRQLYSSYSASISELKKSPTALLNESGNEPIAILNHNTPSAYLVPSETFEKLMDIVDDYLLSQSVKERLAENETPVRVSLNDL